MAAKKILITYILLIVFSGNTMASNDAVRGWIILSDNMDNAMETIKAAKDYDVNHLQRILLDMLPEPTVMVQQK